MRLRTLAAATAVGLVASLAPTVAAEAVSKPAFTVSITTSATKVDLGQALKVSGSVSGPSAARKVVRVQLKVGSGSWKTVRSVRTSSARRYAASIKVTSVGQQSVRVVAPASKKARTGTSKTRGLSGWRWLDLTSRAKGSGDSVQVGPATIAGTTYAKAVTISGRRVTFPVNAKCDVFTAAFGVRDGVMNGTTLAAFISTSSWGDGMPITVSPDAAAKSHRMLLRGASTLGVDVDRGASATMVNPRVHCMLNAAPAMAVRALP